MARILLVEDNTGDVVLLRRAFKKQGFTHDLVVAGNGEEALEKLSSDPGDFELVLLDINLPGLNGFEVLRSLRASTWLLPVVMLTSSNRQSDIRRAYELGANAYLCKPNVFSELMDLVSVLDAFWVRTARVPRRLRS